MEIEFFFYLPVEPSHFSKFYENEAKLYKRNFMRGLRCTKNEIF